MKLHGYQKTAAQELTNRYIDYQRSSNKPKNKKEINIPIILTLASITGSGKTAMLAQTVNNIFDYYIKVKPIVFWLGYSKVIVEQTLNKLSDVDEYKSLILSAEVKSFADINSWDIEEIDTPLIYVDTVQKFNARSEGDRRIYKIEEDKESQSKWSLIVNRKTQEGIKRPLVIVYDEGHHLSNQQVDKILELNPQGIILASGTPSYSVILSNYVKQLKELKYKLETRVPVKKVTTKQMVKHTIALGGYNSPMEVMVNEILQDLRKLEELTQSNNLKHPKVIYVCKTNVLEVDHFEKDKVDLPFEQRKAPPILIWRHLVSQGISEDDIAIYADVEVSKDENYPLKEEFKKNLFGKNGTKENTYKRFVENDFQHIIFNRSLAEGWDNPYVYIAYIDKTIGSEIAVEQIIGRVLRQPNCRYYENEELNKAYFHIRVDEDKVFRKIIDEIKTRLGEDSPIKVREEKLIDKISVPLKLDKTRGVPYLSWETSHIEDRLQSIVSNIPDYSDRKKYSDDYVRNVGNRQWTEYKLDDHNIIQPEIRQEDYSYTNVVRARVVLQRAIIDRNSKVWEVVEDWVAKFDALIGWGSEADKELRKYANQLVDIYLNETFLKVRINKPYRVGSIKVERDEKKCRNFKNALHSKYSNLNGLEIKTAQTLDSLGKDWCRNPHFSGYGIELIDEGSTATFYPDFLLWPNDDTVICLEVTSEWLEKDKLERKLLRIHEPTVEMIDDAPKKVYVIIIIQYGNPLKGEDIYYRVWYRKRNFNEIGNVKVETINEAVRTILSDCL